MTPDYKALKAEIAARPGLSDAALVAAINAPGPAARRPVPMLSVLRFAASTGIRARVEDASRDVASPVRSPCLALIDMFWGVGSGRELDVTDPGVVGLIDALVSAGVMTAAQKPALLDLAAAPGPSVAASIGFPSVSTHDLAHARSL